MQQQGYQRAKIKLILFYSMLFEYFEYQQDSRSFMVSSGRNQISRRQLVKPLSKGD